MAKASTCLVTFLGTAEHRGRQEDGRASKSHGVLRRDICHHTGNGYTTKCKQEREKMLGLFLQVNTD